MSSKKQYVAVAAVIAEEIRSAQTWAGSDDANLSIMHARLNTAQRIARQLANVFAEDNSRFSSQQFLSACNVVDF